MCQWRLTGGDADNIAKVSCSRSACGSRPMSRVTLAVSRGRSSARNSLRLTVGIAPALSASSTCGGISAMRAAPLRASKPLGFASGLTVTLAFQQELQIVRERLRTAAVARIQAQPPLRVVDVAGPRVLHDVAARRLAVDLLVVDLEVLGHGSCLLRVAAQRDHVGTEVRHVGRQ